MAQVLDGVQGGQVRLVAATPALLEAELTSPEELAFALAAPVPHDWPPATWEPGRARRLLEHLREHPDEAGWWTAYLVSHDGVVVGTVGLHGPPRGGEVEIGYALVPSATGLGYATDAVSTVVGACRRHAGIDRVVGNAPVDDRAARGVLERCGFRRDGAGLRPGTARYVLDLGPREPAG